MRTARLSSPRFIRLVGNTTNSTASIGPPSRRTLRLLRYGITTFFRPASPFPTRRPIPSTGQIWTGQGGMACIRSFSPSHSGVARSMLNRSRGKDVKELLDAAEFKSFVDHFTWVLGKLIANTKVQKRKAEECPPETPAPPAKCRQAAKRATVHTKCGEASLPKRSTRTRK